MAKLLFVRCAKPRSVTMPRHRADVNAPICSLNFRLKARGGPQRGEMVFLSLLAGRVRRSADVHVAQVMQHGFVVVAHAFGKLWIVQPLIPRRLRHVL